MSWNHGYALDEYQTRKINGGDHGITWRDMLKCQSFTEMLFGVPWSQRFFLIFHRMGELQESREAANTIREAARDYGKEIINKIELELENLSSFDACRLSRILFILNQNIHPVPKNINPVEL